MQSFLAHHEQQIKGALSGFDRLRFRGTLRWIANREGMSIWLTRTGILYKHFKEYALGLTDRIKQATQQIADQADRPIQYLNSSNLRKETVAREIAARDNISDKLLLRLIGRFLRAGVIVDGVLHATTAGTPQGGPASPLLANILLDDLDKELERRGLKFVRYADDITIFVKSRRSAERVYASVVRYLTQHLHLVVNQEKSKIVASDGVEFLGFVFRGRRATINVSDKSVQRFKHRTRELTSRSWGVSMERRLNELRSYLRGWIGYYGLAAQLKLFDRFDQWIRRRIRMCYWKRWRLCRTRRRELIRLGVPLRQAIRHARSRHSYWHMAKTIASGVGMTNQWLTDQGLISLKPLWAELAPLRRNA